MVTNTNTNTNLKHEVERPGHDDGVVEGDHGGDAEEAVPHPSKAGDKAGEDLGGRLTKLSPQRNTKLTQRNVQTFVADVPVY